MKHTYIRTLASVLALTFPFTAFAATLSVADSIAGLGLDIELRDGTPSSAMDISVVDPDGTRTTMPVHTDATGRAVTVLPGTKTEAAGTYTVNALKDRTTIATTAAQVQPDSMDGRTSTVKVQMPYISADGRDEAAVSVIVRDRFGNPLSGRPIALVSSRTDDNIVSRSTETDIKGTQYFALTTNVPGTIQLRAIDLLSGSPIVESATVTAEGAVGGYSNSNAYAPAYYPSNTTNTATTTNGRMFYAPSPYGAQLTAQSSFDVVDHFEVTAPAQMNAGEEASKISIRAVDRNNVTVEDYLGTIRFVTTDPNATVPNFGTYTFKDRDLGEKSFALSLTFRANGAQVLRIEDANDPRISGETTIMVGGGGTVGSNGITVTSHQNDDEVNTLDIVVEGVGPRFANIIVMGGEQDAYGATDEAGNFSIPVQLNAGQRDYTIRVQDDAGRSDSGPIHLVLDQIAPVIGDISFLPDDPEEDEKVLAVVESEPMLAQVMLRIPDRVNGKVTEIILAENPTQSGSYQAFFDAPAADMYQPSVTAMDRAGNIEEVRTQLAVGSEGLPKVANLRAEPRVDAIELQWDPVPGEVSGYRIYIGDSPTNFLYTLDTERVTTKATVKGLTPGQSYTFAVTAIRGDAESAEKSDAVEATVLGFTLDITPGDGALMVEWTSLTTDLPLSTFLLEYGTDPENLAEQRMLNGELRTFTIRDLINGVKYYISVTPITVTGDTLEELAATGEGTPSGEGFTPGARDDIPFDVRTLPGDTVHPAPSTPGSGIPASAWMIAMAAGIAGVFYRIKKRKNLMRQAAFLQAVQAQYRR